jgi:hypothetical protein
MLKLGHWISWGMMCVGIAMLVSATVLSPTTAFAQGSPYGFTCAGNAVCDDGCTIKIPPCQVLGRQCNQLQLPGQCGGCICENVAGACNCT